METPKHLFDRRVNVFLGDTTAPSPMAFATKPLNGLGGCVRGGRDGDRDATGDAWPDPDSASRCHGATWEISYIPSTCVTCRLHVRLHAVDILRRQLAAHMAGLRAGRPPRSQPLAPSRRRRPRLADGRPPEGTREGAAGRARLRRREDGCPASREQTSPAASMSGSLPGRGRVSAMRTPLRALNSPGLPRDPVMQITRGSA